MSSLAVFIIMTAVMAYVFEMTEQSLRFPESGSGCSQQLPSNGHRHKRAIPIMCGPNPCEGTLSSFTTEDILQERFGRRVNITRLVMDYSLICPLDDTCDRLIDQSLVYNGSRDHDAFKDCPKCTCDSTCTTNSTCCPGCYFGYIEHECTNMHLYPNSSATSNNIITLVSQCANVSEMNSSLHEMCTHELRPCHVYDSCLSYRNKYCALCNGETTSCDEMDLITECSLLSFSTEEAQQALSTQKSLKDFIDLYLCRVTYRTEKGLIECQLGDEPKISTCNITGLWSEYDEEIEWACQNFRTPYGKFKNVFCYICNPSLGNTQSASLMDVCPDQSNTHIPDILREKCDILPSIARMFPYKNIYCFACQFINSPRNFDAGYMVIRHEDIDHIDASLSFNVQLSINMFGVNLEHVLSNVMGTYFKKFTPTPDIALLDHHASTNAYFKEHINDIMDEYVAVCASSSPACSQNTSDRLTVSYSNEVCKVSSCSCENVCAPLFTCCPEFLIQRQPYSTLTCAVNDINDVVNQIGMVDHEETTSDSTECDDSWHQEKKVIVISRCLAAHHNEKIRIKCESMEFDEDILKYLPVSNGARVAYRNIYCLLCNSENGVPMTTVKVSLGLQCNNFLELAFVHTFEELLNLVNIHCDKFNFLPESQRARFSKDLFDYNGSVVYKRALPDAKLNLSHRTIYDKCNMTGTWIDKNVFVQRTCEDVTANILALNPYQYDGIYKNFACFVCNPLIVPQDDTISECDVSEEIDDRNRDLVSLCNATTSYPVWAPYKNFYCAECNELLPLQQMKVLVTDRYLFIPLYKYIFRLSMTDFMHISKPSNDVPDCDGGSFNTVLSKCQQKYCFEGYVLENDVCANSVKSATNNLFYLEFALRVTNKSSSINSQIKPYELQFAISDKIATGLNSETDYFIESMLIKADECDFISTRTATLPVYVGMMVHVLYSPDIKSDKLTLFDVTQSFYLVQSVSDEDSVMIGLESYVDHDRPLPSIPKVCDRSVYHIKKTSILKFIFEEVNDFLFCPMIRFRTDECSVNIFTQTITISSVNLTLDKHQYKIVDEFVYICEENIIKYLERTVQTILTRTETIRISPPLEDALNATTFVCTLLSIGCMSLTFITYCIFPKLREKVIGKSNMILCLVLSVAQCLLQFGIDKTEYGYVCSTIGALLHYFLMCSYCTMNVCTFNMFKIFYINRLVRDRRTKFRKYLLYIVLFPLTLVGAVACVNLVRSDWSEIGYGKEFCFITDFYQMIALFFLPSALIFLANVCLFSLAFNAIRSAPSLSGKQDKRDFFLYLKLCSVVGLTWPVLIVDNLIGLTWFSFVASGLNALQGVFIFFSYIINRRVAYMYRGLILDPKSSQTPC